MSRALVEIQSGLGAWDGEERDALIPIGAAMEALLGEIPEEHDDTEALLMLAVDGLQTLYVGGCDDPAALTESIVAAVAAVAVGIAASPEGTSSPILCLAGRSLCAALGRDGFAWDDGNEEDAANPSGSDDEVERNEAASPAHIYAEPQTLDDAASLLVLLEPADRGALDTLQTGLQKLAGGLPPSVRPSVEAALAVIRQVSSGQCADLEGAMADAGRHLEEAMVAAEDAEMAPAAPPVAPLPTPAPPAPEAAAPAPALPPVDDGGDDILPQDADRALLADFVTECKELVEGAEAALLTIEMDPDDVEAINTVFRAFHTIKGTSAFLGLTRMSELAHRAENMLSRIRDKVIRCTGGYADLALRSVDMLGDLVQALQNNLDGSPTGKPAGLDELMHTLADPEAAGVNHLSSDGYDDIARAEETAPSNGVAAVPEAASEARSAAAEAARVEAPPATDGGAAARPQRAKVSERSDDSSVRVRTDRLDRLIEMVGELVIAQSMVAQDPIVVMGGHLDLTRKVAMTGKIVRELQDLSMSMRMVPLKATFQKMARLVRDLAYKSGKLVEFKSDGDETEIDRNMVDIIAEPLVHMVRNAADHGVEAPEVREASGKPRTGVVHLSAFHTGGNVVVQIKDDGKGLNRDRIIQKAIEKGLIDSEKGLTDAEAYDLIFAPGFSTVDKVTEVSGRGVGMDVVRKGVEALRGRVDISSESGKGTTFQLRLPLTLAITDGMLVKIGEDRYIVPTVNIHLSFRPEASALSTVAGRGELVMLRGELMPIFRLHRLFDIRGAVEDPTKGLLVVIGNEGRRCALLVDELLGQQQVVAKALGNGMGKVQGVSGGAILGDGRVGLILDTTELVALARQSRSGV
ncbi:MAG TPA: chemotaxis protein CheA [Armatimonadota bacterium]|jgi:two-component system chemotaxis sensor kinase CheA